MQDYRLYCLDGAGHISLAEWIEAANDADAVRQAEWMKTGAIKCEVWQGHRLVAVIDGQQISSLPSVEAPRANRTS